MAKMNSRFPLFLDRILPSPRNPFPHIPLDRQNAFGPESAFLTLQKCLLLLFQKDFGVAQLEVEALVAEEISADFRRRRFQVR